MPREHESWGRVKELFEAASELGLAERHELLDRSCAGDDALRREVESLLQSDAEAGDFIEQPVVSFPPEAVEVETSLIGCRFGSYRIVSEIGRGGLGVVYLAERADEQFKKQVALKLIKRGLDTEGILRRFRQEREILATLEHPCIARLLDAGTTEEGLPYFVMEYIKGEPIITYCDISQLNLRQRLELFQNVCGAVSYAHQHLVVHGDLKPTNILVSRDGGLKLLDFGIAKLLHGRDQDFAQTIAEERALTPEYASPEQVRGEAITTASDVYSLGLILYELLTGARPYRLTSHTPNEMLLAVTEQEPARPSRVGTSHSRGAGDGSRTGRSSLKGDLDNIVLKALRKEPDRRYSSAGQFSEDIQRHLDGLPVIARKDTWSYRATKFVRRNKVAVVAGILIILTLIGGIIATTVQAHLAQVERLKAETRFNDVRKLANVYLFELHDAIERLPGSTPARELLVKRALEYLERLSLEAQGDISLQRELSSAYLKVGNVQGNPSNDNLGDTKGALLSYRKALAILKQLTAGGTSADRRLVAVIREKMADVLAANGDIPGAVSNESESLAEFVQLADAIPADRAARRSAAISQIKTGDVLGNPSFPNAGKPEEALAHYQTSAEWLRRLLVEKKDDEKTERMQGVAYERIGTIHHSLRQFDSAVDAYRKSLAIREKIVALSPADSDCVRDSAVAYEKIGDVMVERGDLAAALENRQKSLAIFERLAEIDPRNVRAQESWAISCMHLGELSGGPGSRNLGNTAEAISNYRRALDLLQHLDPATATTRELVQTIENRLLTLRTPEDHAIGYQPR